MFERCQIATSTTPRRKRRRKPSIQTRPKKSGGGRWKKTHKVFLVERELDRLGRRPERLGLERPRQARRTTVVHADVRLEGALPPLEIGSRLDGVADAGEDGAVVWAAELRARAEVRQGVEITADV